MRWRYGLAAIVPAAAAVGFFAGADPHNGSAADAAPAAKADAKVDPSAPIIVDGKVQVTSHRFQAEPGRLYRVRVDGAGFRPHVNLSPSGFSLQSTENDGDTFIGVFMPAAARPHRITVLPAQWDDLVDEPMDCKITVESLPLSKTPVLEAASALAANDPHYKDEDGRDHKVPHKAFTVKLAARKVYVIEMKKGAEFDPALILESPDGKRLSSDDDSAGDDNPRIVFQTRRAGNYKIIALTGDAKQVGAFTLSVRTTD